MINPAQQQENDTSSLFAVLFVYYCTINYNGQILASIIMVQFGDSRKLSLKLCAVFNLHLHHYVRMRKFTIKIMKLFKF